MPVLNKFRIRTPLDEFENYLGEEMNTFAGYFLEESVTEDIIVETTEHPAQLENNEQVISPKSWKERFQKIFKFSSDLFL